MKKLLLLFVMIVMAMTVMAQTTEKITYQAVVRDRTNRLVVYTPVRVDVTITYSSGSYFESLRDTTNANGLMYVLIGGNPGFENINWQRAVIKTVITIEGGETVSDEVVVTAVPIALQANYAMNVSPTAPTIVAVYNQLQADSLALANRIAAERAHLDDTLSHYLMQEVQVLSISNDTIYLTGGSFVKLPAGFSGNYNDLTNLPDLNQYATNVHLNDTLSHYLMQEVQVLSVINDTLYLTGGSWVKLPQGFSGNYNDLTNLPDLNQYATNVHLNDTLSHYLMQEVQVLSVSNDTLYLTGGSWVKLPQGFSGNYNDLTNLPDLNQYATNVHLNDTLKNYLMINGLCDSIKNCEAITNLQTADSLLGVQITRDSIVLSGKIYSDSVYLKGLIDSIKVNVTNNTTNITNNTTNISNITNYVTSLQVADSVLNDRFTRDSIALSNRLDTMFAHICDSIEQCDVITNLQTADSLLGVRITRDSVLFYKADSILANRITRDSILFYMADSIQADRITRDSILSYKADSILSARITADSINLVNNYYDKIKINDTVAYILSQITTASGNLNDNYYTKVEINDTLSHYTTSDRIDSLLGDYVKKDTLENYLTIAGLCDSIKNCDVIANLQTADSLLGIRITRDSILSYKADSILADRITRDSVLFYKTDSILANRITRDSILSYKADSILAVRITRDSVLFYKADSVLSARITADSINLVNNYYDKIKINDTVAYILSQITTASGNLNDNYYTKVEINDTLSHYTTSDRIDSLLGDYVKKDTLENYLTIAGLCDSIKNCDVIANLQTADSLLGVRITRDSILSYKADSVLSVHMINDSILFHKTDSVLLVHILNDSILSYQADSIILARILNDSILSHKADSILAAHILMDSVVSFRSDSILSVRISTDSANLANNYYTKVEINDTLSHYTTTDNIDSLLGDFVKKDTLENYLTIAGLCDSIKNCDVITNLQAADSLLSVRITRDSILFYKADSVLSVHMINDSILFHKTDSVLLVHILNDSVLSHQADSILLALILRDSTNLANNYYDKIKINDTVAYILSQIAGATGNLNDNYYTKLEINDTLSHYTTSDNIDSLLGDFVKKDTLENYLTIAGLCDSIKNCEVITNLQAADSLLGVRITRDSILSYKADSILANRITRDSVMFYKADSILANRITRDSILFYMADSILADRITRDSLLSYKMDSVLSARITADSINLVNNYYDKIIINDTVAYILSQITTATGNLNDNYYTKVEINDTLSHYTTSDRIDSLLGDYVKKDTLENYLTIASLCDSIKNCDVIANMATGITTNTTNISNNTTNITNNTTNITNLQIADSVLNARFTKDSTALAHRMDTLLKHVCDSVKPCVTEWMNDTLKAYTTTNKIDTLLGAYATNAHLNDTLSWYTTTNKIDTLIQKYGYTTIAHLNDTLRQYTTSDYVDTLLNAYEKKADLCKDVMGCIGDTLSKYTTTNNIDTLIQKYGYTTIAHLNDTLRRYTTTNQIDTLIRKYGYLTSDSTVIVTMRDSIQKVNNRLTYDSTKLADRIHTDSIALVNRIVTDSTALAHRMDTLLKHVCDSVKPCVTEWMNDTLKAYTTTNKIDTLLGAYATNAHLNDTLSWYTTTNKIDTLIQKYGYTTIAHLNDTLRQYTTSDYVDTLLNAYEKKADLCKDVMGCIGDTLSKYTTTNNIDTLIQKYGYTTIAHLNDTLRRYTTTNQIDTLIRKYGYLTSDSTVIVTMRDSIQKVNNRLTYDSTKLADRIHTDSIALVNRIVTDSTALAHRMDTLLKHVCDSVKPCVTGWMNDTLKAYTTSNKIDTLLGAYVTNAHLNDTLKVYTTTNKIDTLIQKYGYTTTAHLNDTLRKYTTSNRVDTLLSAYEKKADLCKDVMGCIGDTLSKYTTTNQIDTLIKKYGYLTSDSAVIVRMRDSIQKMNNRLTYDSTALAHRMDTLLKHVCDSVKPCVTGWMNDTLKAYTTSNKIDTLLGAYVTNAHLNDTLKVYTTTNKIDTLIQKYGYTTTAHLNDTLKKYTTSNQVDTLLTAYEKRADLCKDVMGCIGDTLSKYTTTNQIDTLIKKYGYLTSDSAVIVRMRDSIQKVNNRLTYDSTALSHRMDTLLKHVCDSVQPCVTGWIKDSTRMVFDSLHRYYTSLSTLADSMHRVDVRIKHDSLEVVELYKQAQTALQTLALKEMADSLTLATRMDTVYKHLCDSVMNCDGIKTMQTNITDVTNNLDSSKTNIRSEISSLNTKLQSNIDSTSQHVRGALRDTAAAIRNSIGKGTLTIQYGTDDPVTFNANQKTDTSIIIPVPTAPNDATLTIQKNGTTVGTFTANQAADNTINITVPTCDSLAECDLIKSILARLDKLERQNDSLAKEIEKLQPALTVTGPQKDTVCSGSTKPVTYKATFHNCSSSDYTLAWKVNGADSSAVTGAVLTLNVENEGSYKVVCIATRSDNTFVTDTVTTIVSVDTKVPSFTVAITGLTVTLSNVTNTATIQWDTDSMPESFTSNTHTYSVADTITITATSERGCTFTKDTVLQPIAPVVTTDSVPASTIAATTAKAYGTVTSDGGIPETKRGILYSTSDQNLEYGANGVDSVMNGTGKGNYACTLERLVPCTKYYVRAFAYNEVDTVYGVVKEFTTTSFTCGSTLYDIDGNDYETLLLGSQCWMKQNLRTTRYADGTEIPVGGLGLANQTGARRYAPDNNLNTYGYLYNWDAAMHGSASSSANPSGVQGVCPDGWHLPSDAEWTQLTTFVASNSDNVCDNNPSYIAKSLVSTEDWGAGAWSACSSVTTNNTGFSVLPAGTWHVNAALGHIDQGYAVGMAIFRTATVYEEKYVQAKEFYTENPYVDATAIDKTNGLSVRCVLTCPTESAYLPTVSAVKFTDTVGTTVSMTASVISDGGADVEERGVCWSEQPQHPTVSSDTARGGAGLGDFTISHALTPGRTYYVRAYATNSVGTAYGAEVTFVMPNIPTVTTSEVSNIAATTATTGGNVTSDGGLTVTARGVCWSTSSNPTIENDTTINLNLNGSNVGSFVSNLTSLTPSETYHVRAYATNSVGTAYGDEVSFTTTSLVPPTVTTGAVNLNVTTANVITVTATCEGDVTDEGTDAVTARGVCWSISQNPTVDDSLTTDNGSGTGSFTCNITGFNASTTYYVRAYATNSAGTAYGNQVVFTPKVDAKSCAAAPTVTDHEGNVYATVQIGNYCWMRENLRTTTSPKTGTYLVKPARNDAGNVYSSYGSKVAHWPDHKPATYAPKGYGLLYNWCAAMDTASHTTTTATYMEVPTPSNINGNNTYYNLSVTDPYRGICPVGWHIPCLTELNSIINNYNGGKLAGGNDWDDNSSTATSNTTPGNYSYGDRNVSGFTALPAGFFNNYNCQDIGREADFWSTWQMTGEAGSYSGARAMKLYYSSNNSGLATHDKNKGMSVRCVRNEGHAAVIFVTTSAASNIASTSATLNGSISNDSIIPITNRGFELKETVGGSYTPVTPDVDDPLSCNLTGLTPNTAYTFRAFATTSEGTIYGYERSFTTLEDLTGITVTTSAATNIVHNSATLNGDFTNPNNFSITKGFEWKATEDGSYTSVSANDPAFSYSLAGLAVNRAYTYRAFVTTSQGTIYGNEQSFTTEKGYCPNVTKRSNEIQHHLTGIDSLIDVDGNRYAVVQIGSQCWMAENLRTTKYSDGDTIKLNNTHFPYTPSRYYPKGDTNNISTYGYLYNWTAMLGTESPSDAVPSGVQGVCPTGWHLPSAGEWYVLFNTVKSQNEYLCGGGNDTIAKALASTLGWEDPSITRANETPHACKVGYRPENNNATGFNAVPAGRYWSYRSYLYEYFGQWSCMGSVSLYNYDGVDYPYYIYLDFNKKYVSDNIANYYGGSYTYEYAFSVRCVRDEGSGGGSTPSTPTLSVTSDPTDPTVCGSSTATVIYTASITDGEMSDYNFTWSSNPSGTAGANGYTYTVTYTEANTYTVTCTATPTGSGDALSASTQTTVSEDPNCGGGSPTGRLILLDTIQHNFVAQDGDILTNTLINLVKISIAADATVTLQNAIINGTNSSSCKWAGISCEEGDAATIILEGTNTVKGFYEKYPGVYVAENKTLTIQGTGTLNASSNGDGAGIGGGYEISCGNIIVDGGTINANGGFMAAGIGSGVTASCGNITINGGIVTSEGGVMAAGIGSGVSSSCGSITISGGTVTATGVEQAAGIGSGQDGYCGNITISGGTVEANGGDLAAGVGAGFSANRSDTCGSITISGGEVTATGGENGAGIGSGFSYEDGNKSACGNIIINGGTVIAEGGEMAAGIGTGNADAPGLSSCGTITITSGVTHVTATKGSANVENSIGKNHSSNPGTCGTVTIEDPTKVTQN